jgi:hypothetical protein
VRIDGPWITEIPGFPDAIRVHPIEFPFPRTDIAILNVHPPSGYVPGPLPAPVSIESPFGSYTLHAEGQDGGITVSRSLRLPGRSLDAGLIHGLNKFLNGIRDADRTLLVFQPAEGGPL